MNTFNFIFDVLTIALIVILARSVFGARGSEVPITHDSENVYAIKWQWRLLGWGIAGFSTLLAIWSSHDRHAPFWPLIAIAIFFVPTGLWLAAGAVITNKSGIMWRGLWSSRTFKWSEITELWLQTKQAGAIELHAGPKRLVIDFRFNALRHLLKEIQDRTNLESSTR